MDLGGKSRLQTIAAFGWLWLCASSGTSPCSDSFSSQESFTYTATKCASKTLGCGWGDWRQHILAQTKQHSQSVLIMRGWFSCHYNRLESATDFRNSNEINIKAVFLQVVYTHFKKTAFIKMKGCISHGLLCHMGYCLLSEWVCA